MRRDENRIEEDYEGEPKIVDKGTITTRIYRNSFKAFKEKSFKQINDKIEEMTLEIEEGFQQAENYEFRILKIVKSQCKLCNRFNCHRRGLKVT